MKKISLDTESTKNEIINIINDILYENVENSKTYIPILDDELVLDEAISYHACYPIKLDEVKEYLIVYLSDIRNYQDEVENEMDLDEYIEEYGDDYQESPEYQEEYKSVEEDLIEENTIPYVFDEINKAINEYNDSNEE